MGDIQIKVDEAAVEAAARKAVEEAVGKVVNASPLIKNAVEKAIADSMSDITPLLKKALESAVSDVMTSSDVFHKLLQKALLDSSSKLAGAFDASMRRMGKDLALDRTTLEAVVEGVKHNIDAEAAARLELLEARGMGNFA
ncbi:MAG: hypothetical protein RR740_00450 [Pseudomonas sp.]